MHIATHSRLASSALLGAICVGQVLPSGLTTVFFCNGDVKQTDLHKRVVYYYQDAQTTHVSEQDGTQLYHFPNGQVPSDCRRIAL